MTNAKLQNALEKAINAVREAGAQCEFVASHPRPILLIEWKRDWRDEDFDTALMFLTFAIGEVSGGSEIGSIVRCVGIERLDVILRQGCDVEPSDAVLWTDMFSSKALEYGGTEKVLMVFDIHRTKPTYLRVAADTDPIALDELRKTYPTVVRSIDGSRLWLSRLPEHDRRVTSPYEVEHARWIPGDPFEALAGLLVLGRDLAAIRESVLTTIANCPDPKWG